VTEVLLHYPLKTLYHHIKVVALDRWGGKWNQLSIPHRLATNYAKNYCNRTLIVKVIVENVVTCFLGHGVVGNLLQAWLFSTFHLCSKLLTCMSW